MSRSSAGLSKPASTHCATSPARTPAPGAGSRFSITGRMRSSRPMPCSIRRNPRSSRNCSRSAARSTAGPMTAVCAVAFILSSLEIAARVIRDDRRRADVRNSGNSTAVHHLLEEPRCGKKLRWRDARAQFFHMLVDHPADHRRCDRRGRRPSWPHAAATARPARGKSPPWRHLPSGCRSGTQPLPPSHAARYCRPTSIFSDSPASRDRSGGRTEQIRRGDVWTTVCRCN